MCIGISRGVGNFTFPSPCQICINKLTHTYTQAHIAITYVHRDATKIAINHKKYYFYL